jgi:hypothetical protein
MRFVLFTFAAIFYVSAIVCVVAGASQGEELLCEVNERLPEDEKFWPVWWWPWTRYKFQKLHQRVLPESSRPKLIERLTVAGLCLGAAAIILVLVASSLSP